MTCRLLMLGALLVVLTASAAGAQPSASEDALAAEGAGRWDEAVRLYRIALETDSHHADWWVRVADIEARNGHLTECIDALQRAIGAAPAPSAAIYFRLSQAYSMAGQPAAALAAVERAWVLAPTSIEYLRARATLAAWLADYTRASDSYRLLGMLQPHDVDQALSFARVSAWGGNTNEAVTQYERYLKARPDAAEVWLELAKAESWRGNYGSAERALTEYRTRFGETSAYSQELAAVMTGSGRPGRAEDVVAPLLAQSPDNYELNVTHTIALAMQHRVREAFTSLETVRQLAPESRATHNAERILRTMLASTFDPQFTVATDSDQLTVQRFVPRATVALRSGTTVSAGYEHARLDARAGSGLEQVDGSQTADYRHGWMAASQMIGQVKLEPAGRLRECRNARHRHLQRGRGSPRHRQPLVCGESHVRTGRDFAANRRDGADADRSSRPGQLGADAAVDGRGRRVVSGTVGRQPSTGTRRSRRAAALLARRASIWTSACRRIVSRPN